jgi:hypothetical protein
MKYDLKEKNWRAHATALQISRRETCYPSIMNYSENTCGRQTLSMYVGASVPQLAYNTVEDMCSMACTMGFPLCELFGGGQCSKQCMYITMRKYKGDESGARSFLMRLKMDGNVNVAEVIADLRAALDHINDQLILVLYHPKLYPHQHCIFLHRRVDKWYISDPLMPSGACMHVKSNGHMWLLLLSATSILGAPRP